MVTPIAQGTSGMEADYGRKPPNSGKIGELLKQEALAEKVRISVRLLLDIERNNHPVPTTAIATELGVKPGDLTLSIHDSIPALSPLGTGGFDSLLKLRAVQSATELDSLAEGAKQ